MWSIPNSLFNALFDLLLWPLQWLPATVQILVLSVPAAIFALLVYRLVSDQEGIERTKDLIKAHLLELRLYKDDFRVTMRAQGKILRYNATYLRHALLPMAVMIVPFLLMIVQVESRFAFRSLEPGESVILSIGIEGEARVSSLETALELPEGLVQETPALRIDATGEIAWRLGARSPGEYQIGIRVGDEQVTKRVIVDGARTHVSPAVYRGNDLNTLLYPVEASLENQSSVREIHLAYPQDRSVFLGLSSASWIFFAGSMVFGFALRGFFGVTF